MFVRVTRTVADRGVLVHPKDARKQVIDPEADWYCSAFTYGEDAKEYWEDNKQSIQGYKGSAWTSTLYWDIDCETNMELARKATISLYDKLRTLGVESGIELYFSGNKGFHLLLATKGKFNPTETAAICHNLAIEAMVPDEVFDTSVYNITRIFRIANTRHQKSNLYKIPVTYEELKTLKSADIRKMAEQPRDEELATEPVDAELFTKYAEKIKEKVDNVVDLKLVKNGPAVTHDLDFANTPPGYRDCVYALEQGYFGPNERHEGILRLAAFYKNKGFSRKHGINLIFEALERRAVIYSDAKPLDEEECIRDIDQVYMTDWKGVYTCKNDEFLARRCDKGEGPCYAGNKAKLQHMYNIDQLLNSYIKYGEEALVEYPTFDIPWLDERIRLRPKTYSIVAGANGSGKTSLAIQLMLSLNKKKMYHAFFSLDMSDSALVEKLGATCTQYSQREIESAFNANTFNKEVVDEILTSIKEAMPYTLFNTETSVSMRYIENKLVELKEEYPGLQLAIVDYAGRLLGAADNEYANSTANANMANDVVKHTSTHIMFLAQVSRENGDHTDPLRSSRVSKGSGAWEENATTVLTVWRPFGGGVEGRDEYMHIYIAKQRSGPLGENVFRWHGKTGTVSEMENPSEFEEYRNMCENNGLVPPKFNWFDKEIPAVPHNKRFNMAKDATKTSEPVKETKQDAPKNVQNSKSGDYGRPRGSKPNS